MKKTIYDCFLFNGELELLELRLNILENLDCNFVILEAGETHQNQPKPFYYEENKELFKKWHSRIIYIKIPSLGFSMPQANEWFSRNSFYAILDEVRKSDYLMLSDVDEIPCPKQAERYIMKGFDEPFCFLSTNFLYKFNLRQQSDPSWYGAVVFQPKFLLNYDKVKDRNDISRNILGFERLRELRSAFILIPGGWHYSCCFSESEIIRKLSSYSHPEMNTSEVKQSIKDCIRNRVSFYSGAGKLNKVLLIDDKHCPGYLLKNLDKYKHLIDQNE